ncbi:MAG: hypothetical protein ACR2RE_23975 [Geminicoccaceae bacterium]
MTGFYGADASCGNGAASMNHCGMDESHGPNGSLSAKEAEAELAAAMDKLSDKGPMQGGDQETKALLKDIKEMLSELLQKKEGQDGKPGAEDPTGGCGDDMKSGGCGDEPTECGGVKPHDHPDEDHAPGKKGDGNGTPKTGDEQKPDAHVDGHHDHGKSGGCGDDVIHGDCGHDDIDGGYGDDEMRGGKGHDHLDGSKGDDRIYGGKGHDQMHGGKGDDEMRGGKGHDVIRGGDGDDRMYCGKGHDRLVGGEGDNRLYGGAGNDTYVIENGSENVLKDGKGIDTVKLEGDRSDYKMERDGDNLVITSKNDDTKVVIKDQYDGDGGVDTLQFDDGKVNADLAGFKFGLIQPFAR